ncbi:MAG: hypothetical protein GEU77_07315 [Deltaproteobacteria bacterium]|nr:hypothetical protein [Deltaproteobacteria bacterium]
MNDYRKWRIAQFQGFDAWENFNFSNADRYVFAARQTGNSPDRFRQDVYPTNKAIRIEASTSIPTGELFVSSKRVSCCAELLSPYKRWWENRLDC